MAKVKPFRGIRPPKELIEKVASRPYDVLNSDEARAEAGDNEMSLYHIIKPEIDFPQGTDEHSPQVYDKAVENFRRFRDKGWLVQDPRERYYIYAQTMDGRTQYGIVVAANVHDYVNGVIKKHELTRRDKEDDRMLHVKVNNANIEPVFLAFPDNARLQKIIDTVSAGKPEYDFVAEDGFGHRFCISPTVITGRPLQPAWGLKKRSQIPVIPVMRNITILWLLLFPLRIFGLSTIIAWFAISMDCQRKSSLPVLKRISS